MLRELERVYGVCHGCRRCFKLCNAFPTQFVLVDDPDIKRQLADIYGEVFDSFESSTPSAAFDETDTRAQRKTAVNESAKYLRDHLHEVPVMLLAYQLGFGLRRDADPELVRLELALNAERKAA